MKKFLQQLGQFARQERGATVPEYALIVALVTTGLAAAALSIGDAIQGFFAESPQLLPSCTQAPGQVDCASERPLE